MGTVKAYLSDESAQFLDYGEDRARNLASKTDLPDFYRGMYGWWVRYYETLSALNDAIQALDRDRFEAAIADEKAAIEAALAYLDSEFDERKRDGPPPVSKRHARTLKHLLGIERTVNERLEEQAIANNFE